MITYTVETGTLFHVIETPYPAAAEAIAALAIYEVRGTKKAEKLGVLTKVSGGQYVGDDETYMLTEHVCRMIGRMAPATDGVAA